LTVVLGPTGSGKSDLALTIADRFGGEIVNFDSVQIYKGFDIGSAKVPPAQRRGIPHHLIDIAEPQADVTAGTFARQARSAIHEISMRGRLPILAGGTGFYLRALLDGLSPAPERHDALRARLGTHRPAVLHRFLRKRDTLAAARIHPNDRQKLIRAVEMTILTARPASEIQGQPRLELTGYCVLKIGLMPDRSLLYERIKARTAAMFQAGLIEETRALLESGVPPSAKPMQSLGYKQAIAVLNGNLSFDDALAECQTRTRQYAKRQLTWFRAERDVHWIHGFGAELAVQQKATALVSDLMKR
jgi:tRNA dimethylallyltransferase